MPNKKKKNFAKKLWKEKLEKERASHDKNPDPQSHEFYFDEIDTLHQEKYEIKEDDGDLEENKEEELLPFSESEDEEEVEANPDETKEDDEEEEEEVEDDEDSILDEDAEAITQKLLDDDENSEEDIEKGLPSRDAWGDDKSVFFSSDEKWIFKKKFDSQEEFEASKRRMQDVIDEWKEIGALYDEAAADIQIRPIGGEKKTSLPQLPSFKRSSVGKVYTVEEIIQRVKDKLDLQNKDFGENLKLIINSLPKDGTTPSSFDIYPALKKMMDEFQANNKRKMKDCNKMVPKKKKKKVMFELKAEEEEVTSDTDAKQMEKEDNINEDLDEEEQSEEPPSRPLTYEMMKNKGITPYRKKEYRNPRVRNKNKYRKALIKRRSKVATPFEQIPVYQGEKFGINVNVIRSRKFNY